MPMIVENHRVRNRKHASCRGYMGAGLQTGGVLSNVISGGGQAGVQKITGGFVEKSIEKQS